MKRFSSNTAFTLIELIVSLVLVSIILLGIITINMVLSNNNQDYGQKYLVKSETQAMLNQILNAASSAVGTANPNDQAVLLGVLAQVPDLNTFCIHQQPSTGLPAADVWACYTWTNTAAKPYQINSCIEKYTNGVDRGADGCIAPTTAVLYSGPTFLGTARSPPTVTFTQGNGAFAGQSLISVTLINCLNNSAASCQAGGVSTDQADNPEVSLSASVIPLQTSAS